MAIFKETVSKELYDQLWDKYSDLLGKYHSLRSTHNPVAPVKMLKPSGDSAQKAMQAGERALRDPRIGEAAVKLVQEHGLSEADALLEAARLVDIATGKADAANPGAPKSKAPILSAPIAFGPALR